MNSIAERIKYLREHEGIKQAELARSLNVSRSLMSDIENNRRVPTDRTIKDICRVYNVNEEWLVDGIGEMPAPIDDELFELIGEKANDISENMAIVIKMVLSMDDADRKAFDKFVDKFIEEKQKSQK